MVAANIPETLTPTDAIIEMHGSAAGNQEYVAHPVIRESLREKIRESNHLSYSVSSKNYDTPTNISTLKRPLNYVVKLTQSGTQ